MDIVLPNGDLISVGPGSYVRASWPDLRRLFIGSDGTLGIVVRAMLRIKPLTNYHVDKASALRKVMEPQPANAVKAKTRPIPHNTNHWVSMLV